MLDTTAPVKEQLIAEIVTTWSLVGTAWVTADLAIEGLARTKLE